MQQLALFQGAHVPLSAAREAISRGDLRDAQRVLGTLSEGTPEAADAMRLERILRVRVPDASALHDAFASVLAEEGSPGCFAAREWFAIYAGSLCRSLEAEPGRWFRGWLPAHFALAAGQAEAALAGAQRAVAGAPPGPCWLEAARIAYALDEDATAQGWLWRACRESPVDLSPIAPVLQHCGVPALDAAGTLPPLPAAVEELWSEVAALDLSGPRSAWVAVLGEMDGGLGPGGLFDPEKPEDPPGIFLAALRTARRARERDARGAPDRCSDRELRARKRMQQLAPALLARYLRTL